MTYRNPEDKKANVRQYRQTAQGKAVLLAAVYRYRKTEKGRAYRRREWQRRKVKEFLRASAGGPPEGAGTEAGLPPSCGAVPAP